MKIPESHVLVRNRSVDAPVVAVEISFGKTFRWTHGPCREGEIVSSRIDFSDTKKERATTESGHSPCSYKILRKVHPNTVYAELRRVGRAGMRLERGHWYEVHGD